MGWRGTLRSIEAGLREAERNARRRERAAQEQLEREHAAAAVEEYQRYVDRITSIHKTAGDPVDWSRLADGCPPEPPKRTDTHEAAARHALATFQPSIIDRLLGRTDSTRTKLRNRIHAAVAEDEHDFQTRQREYEADLEEWNKTTELARRVLSGDRVMLDVIKERHRFGDIAELGSEIRVELYDTGLLTVSVNVHSEDIVPTEEFSFYKSGKLATKNLPRSRYYELYQDYVCGVVLRVARELCALLPVESLAVTAEDELLNSATGKTEAQPILSVYVDRSTLQSLNFERVDPSDAMKNFVHNMDFKKTQGFRPVPVVDVPRGQ